MAGPANGGVSLAESIDIEPYVGRELCRVEAGKGADSKTGIFLGGHNAVEIFVQCTSPCCVGLPKTLAEGEIVEKHEWKRTGGGCIFRACDFERHALCGRSKKPLYTMCLSGNGGQGVAAGGNGEASNADRLGQPVGGESLAIAALQYNDPALWLASTFELPCNAKTVEEWCKARGRELEARFQLAAEQHKIWVHWPKDRKFYKGTVVDFGCPVVIKNRIVRLCKHRIQYDDGDQEWLWLAMERFSLTAPPEWLAQQEDQAPQGAPEVGEEAAAEAGPQEGQPDAAQVVDPEMQAAGNASQEYYTSEDLSSEEEAERSASGPHSWEAVSGEEPEEEMAQAAAERRSEGGAPAGQAGGPPAGAEGDAELEPEQAQTEVVRERSPAASGSVDRKRKRGDEVAEELEQQQGSARHAAGQPNEGREPSAPRQHAPVTPRSQPAAAHGVIDLTGSPPRQPSDEAAPAVAHLVAALWRCKQSAAAAEAGVTTKLLGGCLAKWVQAGEEERRMVLGAVEANVELGSYEVLAAFLKHYAPDTAVNHAG